MGYVANSGPPIRNRRQRLICTGVYTVATAVPIALTRAHRRTIKQLPVKSVMYVDRRPKKGFLCIREAFLKREMVYNTGGNRVDST